jgi:hypothetical protein
MNTELSEGIRKELQTKDERREALAAKYDEVVIETLLDAMKAKGGNLPELVEAYCKITQEAATSFSSWGVDTEE